MKFEVDSPYKWMTNILIVLMWIGVAAFFVMVISLLGVLTYLAWSEALNG